MHTHVIDTWLCLISWQDCCKIYFGSARTSWSFAGAKREFENANWGLLQCSQGPPQVLIVCSSNALIAYGNCGSWLHTQIATHTHTPSWPWHMSGNEQVAANCGKQSGISKTERRKSSSSLPLCSIMHSAGRGAQHRWAGMVGWTLPFVSLAKNACAFAHGCHFAGICASITLRSCQRTHSMDLVNWRRSSSTTTSWLMCTRMPSRISTHYGFSTWARIV